MSTSYGHSPLACPTHRSPRPTCGFTIVELLVVASIMAVLFGMILVAARPNVGSELRRAAREFASVLLATQSRSIGTPQGAAIVLASTGMSSIEIFAGDLPPPVVGSVSEGMPPANPAATWTNVAIMPTNGGDLRAGFRIQFFAQNPTVPASEWFGFEHPATVRLRDDDGQSPANRVWPAAAAGGLRARVAVHPTRGVLAMQFPRSVGIDLRYSGTGDDPASNWGSLANKNDLALAYDSVGTVSDLMFGLGGPATRARRPVEPVYFLIATRSDIASDQALASERSLWVTVQPQTGRVSVSSNVAQTGKDRTAVRAARERARAAALPGS